ncbi:21469_t:CDS:2 [Cetraspora pellucida]|uniref:21469_t:CDS:1 n=1 Tax=Cetraspora pellucida TaxID=1433469 RepID=A0A9N9D0I7_9GLOM|nr:21469_t:CDS:2 [Cetraspora pellucida]
MQTPRVLLANTLRKHISRENETPNQNEKHRADDRENKCKERGKETVKKRETRLRRDRERKRQKRTKHALESVNEHLNHQNEVSNQNINIPHVEPLSVLAESDQNLLQNFRAEINKLTNTLCLVCNERFPSIELIKEECCRHCYYDKNVIKKFSKENNMDPGDVPEELQGLTEIEKMLIAQIFSVVSVYRLRGGHSAFRDFNVRRVKVTRALYWLKANNCYYADIIINNEILRSLPDNGPVDDQLPQLEDVEDEYFDNNDDEDEDIITSNFVPAPLLSFNEESAIADTLGRMQASNLPIMWLNIDGNPINEFQTPGYIACAFPTLYPTGDGNLQSEHVRKIKPAGYFSHLLKYKDGRFAQHARWRYFALNSQMRWRALQEGKVYVKQSLNGEQLNVEDVQEMADNNNCMADKIVRFGEGLHGTRQFWNKRRAADLHWPELHELMPHGENPVTELDTSKQRHQDLIDNPHIAAWFEWQHRGSTHIHGIGKIQDAPIIEWERMKENEETMSNVVQYLDSLVTTINPGLDAPVPNHHSCQKRPDEIPSYCLRVNSTGQQNCRFGYPKETTESTYLRDNNGQPELIMARNDPYINPHNRLQLQGWRANVDLKPILNMNATIQYISKYTSKSEPRSAAFSDILNRILNNSRPGDSSLGVFQKLLLHTIAERDISAQETCHLLLSIPLYHSSRRFVTLNLNKEAPRWLYGTGYTNEENFSVNSEVGRTVQSPLQKYWSRPIKLEDFSLFQLYLKYNFWNNQWKECKCENIVRIWPRPSPKRNGPQWEEFCCIKVLLHVRHRNLNQLTENKTDLWSDLFNKHHAEIENVHADLLGLPVDNLENKFVNEENEDEQGDEQEREMQLEWMILSEMGPNVIIENSSGLGSHDIDRNYDWVGDVRWHHSDLNFANMANFIQQARTSGTINNENSVANCVENSHTLNEKQLAIFKRIESHYSDLIVNPSQVEPLRLIIMGTAGTGKSHLIKII